MVEGNSYRNMIGYMLFLGQLSPAEIALEVATFSQYSKKPTKLLMKCAHHVFGFWVPQDNC